MKKLNFTGNIQNLLYRWKYDMLMRDGIPLGIYNSLAPVKQHLDEGERDCLRLFLKLGELFIGLHCIYFYKKTLQIDLYRFYDVKNELRSVCACVSASDHYPEGQCNPTWSPQYSTQYSNLIFKGSVAVIVDLLRVYAKKKKDGKGCCRKIMPRQSVVFSKMSSYWTRRMIP